MKRAWTADLEARHRCRVCLALVAVVFIAACDSGDAPQPGANHDEQSSTDATQGSSPPRFDRDVHVLGVMWEEHERLAAADDHNDPGNQSKRAMLQERILEALGTLTTRIQELSPAERQLVENVAEKAATWR